MSRNNSQKEINLRDFIWEQEDFNFNPKVNRHKKFIRAKKRQLEKEAYVDNRKHSIEYFEALTNNDHKRFISKIEESLLQDYYDRDDEEDYKGYRIK